MTVGGMTLEEFIAHTQASTYSHEPLTLLVAVACKQQELADLGEQLLDHFVEEARVVLAQDEVRRLHHDQLGTAHLMLGLLAEGTGTAAQVLAGVGITLDSARAAVEESPAAVGNPQGDAFDWLLRQRRHWSWHWARRARSGTIIWVPSISCLVY
jgi:hypothetical protein